VEAVVCFGKPFLSCEHDGLAMVVVALANVVERFDIGRGLPTFSSPDFPSKQAATHAGDGNGGRV
jgi:hypothetical protein